MSIGTWLFTLLKGEAVGTDSFGNRYYQERKPRPGARRRRWVVYNGDPEASRVPPEWHAWLHYNLDKPPLEPRPPRPWQKPHVPNLTGTPQAYRPPGHDYEGGRRAHATGDYEPWRPS
ncbi:MAG TPA: NADH:ubiquinone oxidoreductase subunit NDUFA12 [Alphaproteobacteria bacterium]